MFDKVRWVPNLYYQLRSRVCYHIYPFPKFTLSISISCYVVQFVTVYCIIYMLSIFNDNYFLQDRDVFSVDLLIKVLRHFECCWKLGSYKFLFAQDLSTPLQGKHHKCCPFCLQWNYGELFISIFNFWFQLVGTYKYSNFFFFKLEIYWTQSHYMSWTRYIFQGNWWWGSSKNAVAEIWEWHW